VLEQGRRFADAHRGGRRQRQALSQNGQPLLLGAQQGRGALGARQAHGQLRPEAPLLVVPATGDISEFETCEIRMLFPQQRSYQVLLEPELVHG
jgi:hypothetical protein